MTGQADSEHAMLERDPDVHRWAFRGYRVTQLLVDTSSARFQLWTLHGSAEIRLGVAFVFRDADGAERVLNPEEPLTLAPLLVIVGVTLAALTVTRAGDLSVDFGDGSCIRASVHPTFEAWEINGVGTLAGLGYLCGPDGSPWG